jgi:MFS family permease
VQSEGSKGGEQAASITADGAFRHPRATAIPSERSEEEHRDRDETARDERDQPARGLRAVVSSFRHRNFRLFFLGQLISLVGTWMQNVAQSWLVYDLTRSAAWLGQVSAAGSVPILLLGLYAGVVTDRRPKRLLLVLTATASMLLAFALAGLSATGRVTVWHVMLLAFLLGSVNAFEMPARQAFAIEMVGRRDLMNAIALNSVVFNGARIVGPAIAAEVLLVAGVAGCFFINGISYFAVIAALLLMRLPAFVAPEVPRAALGQVREGLAYIRHQPLVLTLVLLSGITALFGWPYQVLMPIFARNILEVGSRGFGWLLTANGLGALLGAITVSLLAHRTDKQRWFWVTVPLFTLAVLVFAWSRWLPLSLLMLVLAGWALMMQFATANTLVQTHVPDGLRGRVLSVYILAFSGIMPLGGLQIGRMAEWLGRPEVGTPWALTLSVSIYGLLAMGLLLLRRRPDRPVGREICERK